MGLLSSAGTWPASPVLGPSCPSPALTPTLPRAEYLHGKHGVDVEVQGPHEARDGQLLIRLDLNRKEVLTLRLRNGGTQPVTLTHLFPLCRTPQFAFYNGDQELPCPLGPGECVSTGKSLWWTGACPGKSWCLGKQALAVVSVGGCPCPGLWLLGEYPSPVPSHAAVLPQASATSSMSTARPALWATSRPQCSGSCWVPGSPVQKELALSTLPASWLLWPTVPWLHS